MQSNPVAGQGSPPILLPVFSSGLAGARAWQRRAEAPAQRLGSHPQTGGAGGFFTPVGCPTWRATSVTAYLENGGRLEQAQQMAGHESPRTTKLYDQTDDEITIGKAERMQL